MEKAPILALCQTCGRQFISIGSKVNIDDWKDAWPQESSNTKEPCGGQVILTDEGRKALSH